MMSSLMKDVVDVNDTQLPYKRIYDPELNRIKQVYIFPQDRPEQNPDLDSTRITVKIKMTGITYNCDFHPEAPHPVIPGKSIIGSINYCPPSLSELYRNPRSRKYLVYPYTTCQIEGLHLDQECDCELMYGRDIDGGMQDTISVPFQLLIPIPRNISLHDALFVWDILLPFYIQVTNMAQTIKTSRRKILIVVHDTRKQINEILIILDYFHIPQHMVVVVDKTTIQNQYYDYEQQFENVFCFDSSMMKFVEFACISDNDSQIFTTFPVTAKSDDKCYHHIQLTYQDRIYCEDILTILSRLNHAHEKPETSLPSPTSSEISTSSNNSSHFSSYSTNLKPMHFSWIWYERDYLSLYYADVDFLHEDEDETDHTHSVNEMNKLIALNQLSRICYLNKSAHKKQDKIVPFVTI